MTVATRRCAFCAHEMPAFASQCAECGCGVWDCPRCNAAVTVYVVEKWAGFLRGGRRKQYRCRRCRKVLDGPRF